MKYIFLALFLFLFGCAPKDKESHNPAPSSSLSKVSAEFLAYSIIARDDKLILVDISATGSMLPILDSSTIVVCEKYNGKALRLNDIVVYDRGDKLIIHRIKELRENSVFIVGDNNKFSDGWIDKKTIKYRVVALFFTNKE